MTPLASKLPVPAPWQAAVRRCMADLGERLGLPPTAVAPTRVEEADWRDPQGPQRGLEVWLLAAGQAHCYRARLDGSAAWPRS